MTRCCEACVYLAVDPNAVPCIDCFDNDKFVPWPEKTWEQGRLAGLAGATAEANPHRAPQAGQ
jgi:hypothetical protein